MPKAQLWLFLLAYVCEESNQLFFTLDYFSVYNVIWKWMSLFLSWFFCHQVSQNRPSVSTVTIISVYLLQNKQEEEEEGKANLFFFFLRAKALQSLWSISKSLFCIDLLSQLLEERIYFLTAWSKKWFEKVALSNTFFTIQWSTTLFYPNYNLFDWYWYITAFFPHLTEFKSFKWWLEIVILSIYHFWKNLNIKGFLKHKHHNYFQNNY